VSRSWIVQKLESGQEPQSVMLPLMKRYGQFCPIAKAGEILTERWTLLVLRDLLYGSRASTTCAGACR
jgi:DNA-binding HxlR family transcriptional regulator